jgi:hypothetical protein
MESLIPRRKIYFDVDLHKYTNEFHNPYISVTTLHGKYEEKFDKKAVDIAKACERIGRNAAHPKYLKYKNKTYKTILAEWKQTSEDACDIGNHNHNKLETGIRLTTALDVEFKKTDDNYQRLYTIDEVLENFDSGIVDIDKLDNGVIKAQYPKIYNFLRGIVGQGYRLFPELVVYDEEAMICGCVDLPAIHPNGNFLTVDWKTNKVPMRKEAGYYEKDNNGNILFDQFKRTEETFNEPIQHIPASTYYKYGLQVSHYSKMLADRGLTHKANVIFHIRHDIETASPIAAYNGLKKIDVYDIPYMLDEVNAIREHYMFNKQLTLG